MTESAAQYSTNLSFTDHIATHCNICYQEANCENETQHAGKAEDTEYTHCDENSSHKHSTMLIDSPQQDTGKTRSQHTSQQHETADERAYCLKDEGVTAPPPSLTPTHQDTRRVWVLTSSPMILEEKETVLDNSSDDEEAFLDADYIYGPALPNVDIGLSDEAGGSGNGTP